MIKFSLFENAMDSINHGFEHLNYGVENNNRSDYKQAILSMFQGTEILLKELLLQIDPIYIFDKNSLFEKCEDPMNPTIDEVYICKSIDINRLCKEVIRFYPQYFNKNSLKIMDQMAKERNKIQHFCLEIESKEVQNLILKLYKKILSPALKILSIKVRNDEINYKFNEDLNKIFCFFEVADKEEDFLKLSNEDFTRGSCYDCGNYSLFMFYGDSGYPEKIYCTSCDFERDNIQLDKYRICPECGGNSLIYDDILDGGLCLWHKCANHRDGGVLVDMGYCNECNDYKIEGKCGCNLDEE